MVKFEIKEHIETLSSNERGWTKELNLVSWNDNAPRYDIREWNEDHSRMGKGITLSREEMTKLLAVELKEQ